MFKVILLVVSVSVVWSVACATYIFDENIGLEILDSIRLDEYKPIFHRNFPINVHKHSHYFQIPHIIQEGVQYINEPVHHLHKISQPEFSFHNKEHGNIRQYNKHQNNNQNSQLHQNHKINQHQLEVKSLNSGYSVPQSNNKALYSQNYKHVPDLLKHSFDFENDYSKNKHNSETDQNHKTNQQKLEKKSPHSDFSLSENNNKFYQNSEKFPHFPHLLYKQNFENDYQHTNGPVQSYQHSTQNKEQEEKPSLNKHDVNQQKLINVDFSKSPEPKVEQKITSEDYEKKEDKNNSPEYKNEHNQKSYSPHSIKDQNFNTDYSFQHNEDAYPIIYHQGHLTPSHYINIHDGKIDGLKILKGHNHRFSVLPESLGPINPIYKDIDIIRYHSGAHSTADIHSHIPILISGNVHANLDNEAKYFIRLKSNEAFPGLDSYVPHYFPGNNESHSDIDNFPKYPNQESDISNTNFEQKPELEEYKADEEKINAYANIDDNLSDYKKTDSASTYENNKDEKVDLSYKSEQKAFEVGYKEQSAEHVNSYGSISENKDKDNEQKKIDVPKYSDINSKSSDYSLEQKSLDVKSSSPKVDYASNGNDGKYSNSEDGQKAVDTDFKSGQQKYDYKPQESIELSNIGESKYPEKHSKKLDENLEQKSVEIYKEIKASFKSSNDAKDTIGLSHKDYSDNIRKAITDLKKDIDTKISNYEIPSYVPNVKHGHPNGGSSSSYFNSHHAPNIKNDFNYGKVSGYPRYPQSDNHNKPKFAGNIHSSGGSGFPKYPTHSSNSYNHHRSHPTYSRSHGGTSGLNFNRHHPSRKLPITQNLGYSHQNTPYNKAVKSPPHLGISSYPSRSAVPVYHQKSYSGISTPLQYKRPEPYNNEKFVKITYEYPNHSHKKDEPIYVSSTKPNSQYKMALHSPNSYHPLKNYQSPHTGHPFLKSHSHSSANSYAPTKKENDYKSKSEEPLISYPIYHDKDDKDEKISKDGYSSIEYPGIGGESHPTVPKSESKEYSESPAAKHSPTEQKTYKNEESIPTYSEHNSKPSKEEDYGIGEIGTIPSGKSEIVGGRHPVKRPVKSSTVKAKSPNKKEVKSDDKTEQKYLPITATLSDKKTDSKKYADSIKTKIPDKTEQEELGYEAFLAGDGPQNHPSVSSGYGFYAPAAPRSPYSSGDDDNEHSAPMPYEFGFDIKDDKHGSEQYRREKMDDKGYLSGSYGFKDSEGIFREVEYEASKDGFKVNKIKTNEPGTDNEDPADVHFEVQKHR